MKKEAGDAERGMFSLVVADLDDPRHAAAIMALLDDYASSPTGGGQPLPDETRRRLIPELRKRAATTHILLGFADGEAAGLLIAFEGFSTFAGRPLLNIHDLMVSVPWRGKGLCTLLLRRIESLAADLGCCKLTLEVLADNHPALAAYRAFGFEPYRLDPTGGCAQFWHKVAEPVHPDGYEAL